MTSALIVLTGSNMWTMKDGTPHPTGFWMEEFVKPHQAFTAAGLQITIATPRGITPTVDPLSLSVAYNHNDPAVVASQQAYLKEQESALQAPMPLEDVNPADFDIVFVVGGHGPMQDLAVDPDIGGILGAMLDDPNKIVAAVCHGPAGFLSAHRQDGTWLFKGRKLTAFSNEEETQATFAGNAPWLLEDRLRLAGAIYEAQPAWTPHVVVDGNLITGQQNYSAEVTAKAVLEQLRSVASTPVEAGRT
jgi:putative intracellular protease/amidase